MLTCGRRGARPGAAARPAPSSPRTTLPAASAAAPPLRGPGIGPPETVLDPRASASPSPPTGLEDRSRRAAHRPPRAPASPARGPRSPPAPGAAPARSRRPPPGKGRNIAPGASPGPPRTPAPARRGARRRKSGPPGRTASAPRDPQRGAGVRPIDRWRRPAIPSHLLDVDQKGFELGRPGVRVPHKRGEHVGQPVLGLLREHLGRDADESPVDGDADLPDLLPAEIQLTQPPGDDRAHLDLAALRSHPHHVPVRDALLLRQAFRQLHERLGLELDQTLDLLGDVVLVLREAGGRGDAGTLVR